MAGGRGASAGRSDGAPLVLHASCVVLGGAGVLITGAAGRGKSGLALGVMAVGADLVADDRTCLWTPDGVELMADAPDSLRGLSEARHVGILGARAAGPCRLALAVDLDVAEEMRLPPFRKSTIMWSELPLLHFVDNPGFPAAIVQYVKGGRRD